MNHFEIFRRILLSVIKTFCNSCVYFYWIDLFASEGETFYLAHFSTKREMGLRFFLKNPDISRRWNEIIFEMTFPKNEIIVKIEDNLMAETCVLSNIHFWDFLAETFKTGGQKGAWCSLYSCRETLGGKWRGREKK